MIKTVRFVTIENALDDAEEQAAVAELRKRYKDIAFQRPKTGRERIHKFAIFRDENGCKRTLRRTSIIKGDES